MDPLLQVLLTVAGIATPLVGVLWRQGRKNSVTNQYFDPLSPVGANMGTIPQQMTQLRDDHKELMTHLNNVTMVWKPEVINHQAEQDRRLDHLESR